MNLATIVTQNVNTVQVFALIALIVFVVAAAAAAMSRTFYAVLMAAGLALLAAAVMFLA